MSRDTQAVMGLFVLCVAGLITYATLGGGPPETATPSAPPEAKTEDVMERSWSFYETRDPFERPRPYSPTPAGMGNMEAETCGACHQEIYKEWAVSTHRRAWLDDAQFQKELEKSRGKHAKPGDTTGDVGWLCVNCHTPMMNQLEEVVVGLEGDDIGRPLYEKNPGFVRSFQEDAITCATCHVKNGVIHGPYGDATHAPHPVAKDESLLTEAVCTSCHQAERVYEEKVLGCFFDTGQQWRESSYGAAGETCQSCHMPVVERQIAEGFGGPVRKTRRHWFGGSLIPKKPEFEAEIAPLRKVYGSGVTFALLPGTTGACQGCLSFVVRVSNNRAGHHVPTGDPERHVDVEARALGPDGTELAKASYRFGSKFQWWPTIKKLSDTRLPAGEHKDIAIEVPGPLAPGTVVEVRAWKWRMYEDGFAYHELEGQYVRGRSFHRSRWSVGEEGARLLEVEDDFGARTKLTP